ncbi:MAG: DsrE/DsrF-like family protein [Euryarchaeota archaeon ADurb.BinA087]|nr:MAG: DsrE/DsrF-like family protein [Euryarchaeota archaeon ADurb.BinA087]HQA79568.1 DsrE family protein [Methanoregulaceae archaeon]
MNGNIFFTSEGITSERFSWLVEVMKFYISKIYPESLHHHPRTRTPQFTFFLRGDACYSFIDRQNRHFLENMFKLPSIQFVFDSSELHLRGVSLEPIKMRLPEQTIISPSLDTKSGSSFWSLLLEKVLDNSESSAIGFLFMHTPSPYQSSSYVLDLFRCAIEKGISPEFYGYLDGVHALHRDQAPLYHENIAESLSDINKFAVKRGLYSTALVCSQSATSRGYRTFIGENGKVISNCIDTPSKITSLDSIVSRFSKIHPILSHTSFSTEIITQRRIPTIVNSPNKMPPSLVILATRTPYGTEYTKGAITLAMACAHKGIATRIIFIEDGVYIVSGHHSQEREYPPYDLQAVIKKNSHLENLEYYVYSPSMKNRGLAANPQLKTVCAISPAELAQLLLKPPANIEAGHQRVLVF